MSSTVNGVGLDRTSLRAGRFHCRYRWINWPVANLIRLPYICRDIAEHYCGLAPGFSACLRVCGFGPSDARFGAGVNLSVQHALDDNVGSRVC